MTAPVFAFALNDPATIRNVLRMFARGNDSQTIADLLLLPEAVIVRVLAEHRGARR